MCGKKSARCHTSPRSCANDLEPVSNTSCCNLPLIPQKLPVGHPAARYLATSKVLGLKQPIKLHPSEKEKVRVMKSGKAAERLQGWKTSRVPPHKDLRKRLRKPSWKVATSSSPVRNQISRRTPDRASRGEQVSSAVGFIWTLLRAAGPPPHHPHHHRRRGNRTSTLPVLSVPVTSLNRYCANLKISRLHLFLQLILAPSGSRSGRGLCSSSGVGPGLACAPACQVIKIFLSAVYFLL